MAKRKLYSSKNEKPIDLGALQDDFVAKRKKADAADRALERAQEARDKAFFDEAAAEQTLKSATRNVLVPK